MDDFNFLHKAFDEYCSGTTKRSDPTKKNHQENHNLLLSNVSNVSNVSNDERIFLKIVTETHMTPKRQFEATCEFIVKKEHENGEVCTFLDEITDDKTSQIVSKETIKEIAVSFPKRGIDLREMLRSIEKKLIELALEQGKENRNQTAKLLGLNRTTLLEKMKKFSI